MAAQTESLMIAFARRARVLSDRDAFKEKNARACHHRSPVNLDEWLDARSDHGIERNTAMSATVREHRAGRRQI